ncbi:MAG: FHA domain-containing protein, partial [Deltaproteobacteria bacterium]
CVQQVPFGACVDDRGEAVRRRDVVTDDAQTRLQVGAQHPVIRAERPFVLRVGDVEHGPFMGSVSVGSAASNGVVLDDPTVSRFHFELSRDQRGIRIVDVGSKNGTFVGDARVRDATIDSGARIRVGDTVLELSVNDTPELVQDDKRSGFGGLIGTSPSMQALFRLLEKLAVVDTPVLVQGETGTGDGHRQGPRGARAARTGASGRGALRGVRLRRGGADARGE